MMPLPTLHWNFKNVSLQICQKSSNDRLVHSQWISDSCSTHVAETCRFHIVQKQKKKARKWQVSAPHLHQSQESEPHQCEYSPCACLWSVSARCTSRKNPRSLKQSHVFGFLTMPNRVFSDLNNKNKKPSVCRNVVISTKNGETWWENMVKTDDFNWFQYFSSSIFSRHCSAMALDKS